MSKSLDFCKTRALNPETSHWSDRNWNEAQELDISPFIDNILGDIRRYKICGKLDDETEVQYSVMLTINPDGEFDYFTSDSFLSDGTLLFERESIDKLINKVLTLQTHNIKLGMPTNGCEIHWTIGNFIILHEYDGDWVPEDRQWMRSRTSILLPLKCVYE